MERRIKRKRWVKTMKEGEEERKKEEIWRKEEREGGGAIG